MSVRILTECASYSLSWHNYYFITNSELFSHSACKNITKGVGLVNFTFSFIRLYDVILKAWYSVDFVESNVNS